MEFEKEENKVFTYITYTFIAVFVLVILILAYFGSRNSDVQRGNSAEIPLTPAEVQAERAKLTNDNVKPELTANTEQLDTTASMPNFTDEEMEEYKARVSTVNNDPVVKVDESLTLNENQTVKANPGESSDSVSSIQVYSAEGQENVQASVETTPGDKENKNVTGTIYSIDNEKMKIIIVKSNDEGLASVRLTNNTKILINGKTISLSDLKGADRVRVEGVGYPGNSNIEASTISLIGVIQPNP